MARIGDLVKMGKMLVQIIISLDMRLHKLVNKMVFFSEKTGINKLPWKTSENDSFPHSADFGT